MRSIKSKLPGRRHSSGPMIMDAAGSERRRASAGQTQAERMRAQIPLAIARLGARMAVPTRPAPTRDQLLERMRSRMRPVPEITTVDDIYELHETDRPASPAYRVNRELLASIGIAGVLHAAPNIEKTGVNEALGAHFDEYRHIGAEWTAWTSIVGDGTLHASFLTDEQFAEYQRAVDASEDGVFDERLQLLRAAIGAQCINSGESVRFMARYSENDTFLLWHGSLDDGVANPGAHLFDRTGEGVYTIHAAARNLGDLVPAGFTRLS